MPETTKADAQNMAIIHISTKLLQQMLLLPEEYEIVGASNDLFMSGVLALQVRCADDIPSELMAPWYNRVEIEGRQYVQLDRIEWQQAEVSPYAGLVTFPGWLIAPGDEGMPASLKPLYQHLLYYCYKHFTDSLQINSVQMFRLAGADNLEQVKSMLARLQAREFLTWRTEGIGKGRKWYVTLTPTKGERKAQQHEREHSPSPQHA